MLNLFYAEPDNDRWLPFDRYPRRIIRRIVHGKLRPGGHARVFLNLVKGLRLIGAPFRVNDFGFARKTPTALACIVGKSFLLDHVPWRNPILFGASGYSHPVDDPHLLDRLPVKKILVPGPWMTKMCQPYWGKAVQDWPTGIDSALWTPTPSAQKTIDVLLYDKVRWEHETYETSLLEPIRAALRGRGRSFREIRYGFYREEDFHDALSQCKAMIFVCEHETQGIAYQQALSCDVPILAWDRQGPWQDPSYFPHKVIYEPVTTVPYWDERCGMTFPNTQEFEASWDEFWQGVEQGRYAPRDYILENLTLEKCAREYAAIASSLE